MAAASKALAAAAAAADPERQRRLATVVVGGAGATGVELAGELAEMLPEVTSGHGLAPDRPAVQLVEAGPAIIPGSSPQLIDKATRIIFGVQVRTNAAIAAATEEGFRLKDGQLVEGGVFVWAGGVKAPELVADSGLPTGHNGRVKVNQYLRVLDHPEICAGFCAVTRNRTGSTRRRWPGCRWPTRAVCRRSNCLGRTAAALDRRVRARDRLTRAASEHKVRIEDLVRQLMPMTPLTGDLGKANLAVLRTLADPRALLAAGTAELTRLITSTSGRQQGDERARQWRAGARGRR